MTQGASGTQMRGGCSRGSCSSPVSSPKYGRPSFYFWVCRGSAWRGSTCHPFSPYMICGGMFELPPPPTPSLSQTRLLSVGWVCWSVIGWVLNIIPQALMLNKTRQSCKPSAVGQMLLCKDSQTCITRSPPSPVDSLAFWVLWCQSWRLLHFFSHSQWWRRKATAKNLENCHWYFITGISIKVYIYKTVHPRLSVQTDRTTCVTPVSVVGSRPCCPLILNSLFGQYKGKNKYNPSPDRLWTKNLAQWW